MKYDVLIVGGEVIDPSQRMRGRLDVAVAGERIADIRPDIPAEQARHVIDARGRLVMPGLVDLHVHAYRDHTTLGLDPDPLCAAGGVTTMLDTGSSGSHNFPGFLRDVITPAQTEVLALIHLSALGLATFNRTGELLDRALADPEGVVATIRAHPSVAVGVKIRATGRLIGRGEAGWANLRDAVAAAREARTMLMVHIGETPMPVPEIVELLEPGDCITHCFKGGSERILDPDDRVWPAVREAAERGVIFDIGHGSGSFEWEVADAAIAQGFLPQTISTDLHTLNVNGPVFDMPTTMSKFLHLGLSLEEVVERSTLAPAKALLRDHEIGTLRPGTRADIAVLEEREGRFVFTDSMGTDRIGTRCLRAAATVRRGQIVPGGGGWYPHRQEVTE